MKKPDHIEQELKAAVKKIPVKFENSSKNLHADIEKQLERPEAKKLKMKVIAVSVATAATLGLLVGNTFDNPADLTQVPDDSNIIPIVQMVTNDMPQNDGGASANPDSQDDQRRRGKILKRVRVFLLQLPLWVRVVFCVPLWGIGVGLMAFFSLLGNMLLPEAGSVLARILITAGLLLAMVVGTCKIVAPNLPVKEILKPKAILSCVAGAVLAETGLVILSLSFDGGEKIARLLHCILSLGALFIITWPLLRKGKKNSLPKAEKA